MAISALRRWFASATKSVRNPIQTRKVRPTLDALEDRALPSATLLVNDNWTITKDVDHSGTLTAGDLVSNSKDTGAARVTGTFGTTAFSSINAAVDASAAGGTIKVLQGTYTENVVLDQSVTLLGANAGISAGSNIGTAARPRGAESTIVGGISVEADNATIDGFTIRNGVNIVSDVAGVFLASGASDATIANNIITGTGTAGRGILSAFNGDNDNIVIRNNNISNWATGIYNQSNTNVDITGNNIHNNVAGISNDFVDDLTIERNTIANNSLEGIGTFSSTEVEVHFNNLLANGTAIHNYGGEEINAQSNWFGTTKAAMIAAMVEGDVDTSHALAFRLTSSTQFFTDDSDNQLVVDPSSGKFQLVLANGDTYSGSGAKVHGRTVTINTTIDDVRIHVNVNGQGRMKIDVREMAHHGHGHDD